MKLTRAIVIHSLLLMTVLCLTSCLRTEWGKQALDVGGITISFEMPKPFVEKKANVALPSGKLPWETTYTSEGDDSITYSVRKMDIAAASWQYDGFDRRAVLDLGLNRENPNGDRIVDRRDFRDETWPEQIQLSEELTVESGDGKTVKHIRMLLTEGREAQWAYVILSATRPKDSSRSPDIDKFFNSLKICTGDQRPSRC